MKKIILSLAIVGFVSQTQAQKISAKDVPSVVKEAFSKAYPSVTDVDWSKDGSNFEAEYDAKKVDMSITYSPTGKLIETEMGIPTSSLPAGVMEYVKKNYKEDEVKEASKITDANGVITYEAEVKGLDLIFDSKGNFIKSIKA
jgi:hypothetical protein